MWWKEYQDVRPDDSLLQEQVEPGQGIVGCEMHGIYGWGERYSRPATHTSTHTSTSISSSEGLFSYLRTLFTSKPKT